MYEFCAKQSKGQKTNGSNWPLCFVFSGKVIQALFGCLQSVARKNENTSAETQIQADARYRRKHARTPAQRLEHDEWCLRSRGCTSLGRRTNFVPSSVLCLSFLVSDEPAETVGNNVSVNKGSITHP